VVSEPPRYFVEQTPARQRNVALALARLTRPFSVFGPVLAEGDDFDALASRLPQDASEADPTLVLATEAVRHRLWQMPALAADDEPPTPAWFAYRSVVAHIYAADAVSPHQRRACGTRTWLSKTCSMRRASRLAMNTSQRGWKTPFAPR
jgi:hypothetical protein